MVCYVDFQPSTAVHSKWTSLQWITWIILITSHYPIIRLFWPHVSFKVVVWDISESSLAEWYTWSVQWLHRGLLFRQVMGCKSLQTPWSRLIWLHHKAVIRLKWLCLFVCLADALMQGTQCRVHFDTSLYLHSWVLLEQSRWSTEL